MTIWLCILLGVFTLSFLCHISSNVNFLLKFIYLYGAYLTVSALIIPFCLLRPRHPRNGVMTAKLLRFVSRLIPVTFKIEGIEHLKVPTAAVLIMNHQSSIDLMAMMEIWPVLENAAPIAKKELKYVGTFGLGCWLCGCVFIDRKSKSSHADMNRVGNEAKETGTKLMVFPEGTRNSSKGLNLLPFKKGAFHVALDGKLPILPVVISEYDFLDQTKWIFNSGEITIRALPRIDTSMYSKENINELVEHSRNIMQEELRAMAKIKSE